MAEIARIDGDCDFNLIVPGINVEQVLRDAADAIDDDEVILTPSDKVTVEWWRTNPCHPNNCVEGGGHRSHYERTGRATRGGFLAAAWTVGYRDYQEAPR